MAKYRALVGTESLLQRFANAGSLDATRKAEAEAHADNWIDRELSDWNNAAISAPGGIPPQVDELASIVAQARYMELELGTRGRSAAADSDGMVAGLLREARAIVEKIQSTGFIHGADGERLYREDPRRRSMQVDLLA